MTLSYVALATAAIFCAFSLWLLRCTRQILDDAGDLYRAAKRHYNASAALSQATADFINGELTAAEYLSMWPDD